MCRCVSIDSSPVCLCVYIYLSFYLPLFVLVCFCERVGVCLGMSPVYLCMRIYLSISLCLFVFLCSCKRVGVFLSIHHHISPPFHEVHSLENKDKQEAVVIFLLSLLVLPGMEIIVRTPQEHCQMA